MAIRMRYPHALPLLAVVLAAGCEKTVATEHPHVQDVSALALEEVLRIGSVEDPELGFSTIGPVHVESAGEIWVAETTAREVRVYDAAGRRVARYGRQGDGPGEFRSISRFGLLGDTLWVSDGTLRRMTFFRRSGELIGTVTGLLEVPIGYISSSPLMRTVVVYPGELDGEGRIVGYVSSAIYPNLPDSVVLVPRVIFDDRGEVVDTLDQVRTRVSRPAVEVPLSSGRRYVYLSPPVPDSGSYGVLAGQDSVYVRWEVRGPAPTGVLEVRRGSVTSGWRFEAALRYDPRPVTGAYLDSLVTASIGSSSTPADSAAIRRAQQDAIRMPPHHFPVTPPRGGEDGSAWIRLTAPDPAANRWLVFTPEGPLRGVVELAPRALIRWTEGDRLWVVEPDAFEVPWLVLYRLREQP